MIARTRAPALLGALLLTIVGCSTDRQAQPAESPMPPPAEPPADMSAAKPAASAAAQPDSAPAPGEVAKTDDAKQPPAAEEKKVTPLSDAQIAAITDLANTAEIEQAKVARAKSKNPEVLKFSSMMIAHHGEAKQKQAKLKLTPADSAISTKLLEDSNRTLASLKDSKAADFDRRYIDAQVEGHREVLDALDNELLPNVKSADLKAYLEEIKPKVEQHLQAARAAQQSLEAAAGARGSSGTSMK